MPHRLTDLRPLMACARKRAPVAQQGWADSVPEEEEDAPRPPSLLRWPKPPRAPPPALPPVSTAQRTADHKEQPDARRGVAAIQGGPRARCRSSDREDARRSVQQEEPCDEAPPRPHHHIRAASVGSDRRHPRPSSGGCKASSAAGAAGRRPAAAAAEPPPPHATDPVNAGQGSSGCLQQVSAALGAARRRRGNSRPWSAARSREVASHSGSLKPVAPTDLSLASARTASLARQLLMAVYEQPLADEAVLVLLDSCPEIGWLLQCARNSPLPLGWTVDGEPGGATPRYINFNTGEFLEVLPHLAHFSRLARLVIYARQNHVGAAVAASWVRIARDEAQDEALRLQAGWTGPHHDTDGTGREFYHCGATGASSWTSPAAAATYVAHVADKLLTSQIFYTDEAAAEIQRRQPVCGFSKSEQWPREPGVSDNAASRGHAGLNPVDAAAGGAAPRASGSSSASIGACGSGAGPSNDLEDALTGNTGKNGSAAMALAGAAAAVAAAAAALVGTGPNTGCGAAVSTESLRMAASALKAAGAQAPVSSVTPQVTSSGCQSATVPAGDPTADSAQQAQRIPSRERVSCADTVGGGRDDAHVHAEARGGHQQGSKTSATATAGADYSDMRQRARPRLLLPALSAVASNASDSDRHSSSSSLLVPSIAPESGSRSSEADAATAHGQLQKVRLLMTHFEGKRPAVPRLTLPALPQGAGGRVAGPPPTPITPSIHSPIDAMINQSEEDTSIVVLDDRVAQHEVWRPEATQQQRDLLPTGPASVLPQRMAIVLDESSDASDEVEEANVSVENILVSSEPSVEAQCQLLEEACAFDEPSCADRSNATMGTPISSGGDGKAATPPHREGEALAVMLSPLGGA